MSDMNKIRIDLPGSQFHNCTGHRDPLRPGYSMGKTWAVVLDNPPFYRQGKFSPLDPEAHRTFYFSPSSVKVHFGV